MDQQTSGAKGEVFEREIHAQKREREEDPERATAIESDKDAPPKRHRGETLGTVQSVSVQRLRRRTIIWNLSLIM